MISRQSLGLSGNALAAAMLAACWLFFTVEVVIARQLNADLSFFQIALVRILWS